VWLTGINTNYLEQFPEWRAARWSWSSVPSWGPWSL